MIGIIERFRRNEVYQKFKNYYDVQTYDIDESNPHLHFNILSICVKHFVCLPTPMKSSGKCDLILLKMF